ncbi:protein FAR1-RELATED SEQUENCE 5 [Daucus carota subsp. sativus]|uniref:protein FAR1-RELATED SEQUENCE 5 n=1 Tax=Daucus carota subsp. sativus TaxID=79200 RepID=UPI003082B8FC
MSIVIPVLLMQLWAHDIKVDAQFETEAQKGIKIRSNYCLKVVNIITRLKLHLARVGGVPNEAVIVQKNLHLDEKAFKQFREKLKAQEEQYRKIQETTNHQHNEKVQEVEEKNYELEILGDQPGVKEKELLSKDDEMDRLRERAKGAEIPSMTKVSPHIESSESDTTVHDTEPQISESSCSSDSDEDVGEQNEVDSPESLEDAFIFYKEYGRICGFDVRKYTKRTDRFGNLYAKYLICNRGGSSRPKKLLDDVGNVVEGPFRKTSSKRCNFPAQVVLKTAGNRGFVLMGFIEEHNHPLVSGAGRMFLRCNRHLSHAYQQFIMDCARANIGATRAHSLVKEMTGSYENVGATISDFKNFSRDVKVRIGDHDTDKLLGKLKDRRSKPENSFYYDYKVDKKGHLTGLFWTDAIGQANYEVFGDIVSFDPTFRTNNYNMVFVPFTGVDNHWKNVTFAAGLLSNEKYKSFKWLINTFKTVMGRAPSCVITDQCPAIRKALEKWWPSTKHRLCMWHIMNKLPLKVGLKLACNKKFVEKLKSAVYSDHLTPHAFEEHIEMAGLLRTTSRSESSNFFFQHYHESGDTLVEFFSSFESAMDKQRMRNADDERRSEQIPLTVTSMSIELDASKIPRDFVKPRWQKNAIRNHSFLSSSNNGDTCVDRDRAKLKRTRAWFEFNNCINLAGDSEEFLDTVLNGLQCTRPFLKRKVHAT